MRPDQAQARPAIVSRVQRHGELLILGFLLVLAFVLRMHDYTAAPKFSDNADELAWAWAGQSLIQDHNPTSWTYLPGHPSSFLQSTSWGRQMPTVHQWLDHPPLFALIEGRAAIAGGQTTPQQVTADTIRPPVIYLSMISLLLLWRLGRRIVGWRATLVAIAIVAVSPAAVVGSRLVEAEALLAPMLLCLLLLIHRIMRNDHDWMDVALLVGICAAAPMVKVPGATFGIIAAVGLLSYRLWLPALGAIVGTLAGVSAFALYGAWVN